MAECRRFEACGDDGLRRMSAALRREARAERPAFSPALQERVLLALEANRDRRVSGTTPAPGQAALQSVRPMAWTGAVGGLVAAACVAIMVAPVGPRPEPPPAAVAVQGIEVLPTPEEIGSSVFAEVATLAAAAVGVADLPDLAVFDPASFVATGEPRP